LHRQNGGFLKNNVEHFEIPLTLTFYREQSLKQVMVIEKNIWLLWDKTFHDLFIEMME
jgi:hypothetical protein